MLCHTRATRGVNNDQPGSPPDHSWPQANAWIRAPLEGSPALDQTQVPPAGLAPGWLQDRVRIVVGHQGAGIPSRRRREA